MSLALFGRRFIALELAVVGAAYYGFRKLNTDAEFRRSVHANAPFVIEAFASVAGKSVEELLLPDPTTTSQPSPATTTDSEVQQRGGGDEKSR